MILVTGATGTNGRLVAQGLLAVGVPVRAMVQSAGKAADLEKAGAQVVVGDYDDAGSLTAAMSGVDRCLLLSPVDRQLVERETRFVEAARKSGLRHLVKFSGIGAHPAASSTFGRQHGCAERMIMDSGVTFTFVQPTFFMQNLLIKARGEIYSNLGVTPASHVDARDIARVIVATLTDPIDRHAGRIHLVTGPTALTFDEIAEGLTRVLGRSIRHVGITDDQLKAGLLASGQSEWLATGTVELNTYARQGHASVVTDTVERIGGKPARTLEEWARDHAAAFRVG